MTAFNDFEINRSPGVLIVDSDPRSSSELATALKAQGWRVWLATDGPSAVGTYRESQHQINVALVDLQLPGLQGGIVLAELAQINRDLVRCAMTGEISPYAAAAFRRMSDTPLFTKPLALRALIHTLTEMIAPVERLLVAV